MRQNELVERHERRVICAIADDNAVLDSLSLAESDMLGFKAKVALRCATELRHAGKAFDILTLADTCERVAPGQMQDWLMQSQVEHVGVALVGAEESAAAIRDESRKRTLLAGLKEIIAKHDSLAFEEMQDRVGSTLIESDRAPRTAKPIAKVLFERITELQAHGDVTAATGFPTGVGELDAMLGGVQPGIVTVFAGRPAMGKSSICLSIAKACAEQGVGVHAFTLEDSIASYADRTISRYAQIETQKVRRGGITRAALESIRPALGNQSSWLVDADEPEGPEQIIRSVRARAKKNSTRVVIVDYLQVVANCVKMEERDAIRHCMQMFMLAAKRDNMAYVVLSQLNRKSEDRSDRRPSLADMHGSGAIEQFAKCVIGLYRPGYYITNDAEYVNAYTAAEIKARANGTTNTLMPLEQAKRTIELIILKNNNGSTGSAFGNWKGEFCEIT